MKECEISIRGAGKNQKRRRGLAYGQKVEKREVSQHKREREVIEKMKEFRAKGYSYRKIAEILNVLKVPTKTKKGLWYGKTIYQVLKKVE
ncbi:recombinase family protein [Halobacteriovorax sp. JY17]|uniref:recombinase family protein n=1 Tax=Halobacteriovorax sp. JY17 TaxID=2014617 RepID=UPI000C61C6B7|nr:recombinase family protein [Halobacteriovorax sp. JY17]PIK13975.1 MAG: hypothetical protein CES88_13405 [Halobacteriovorax sp. JY17]